MVLVTNSQNKQSGSVKAMINYSPSFQLIKWHDHKLILFTRVKEAKMLCNQIIGLVLTSNLQKELYVFRKLYALWLNIIMSTTLTSINN